MTDITITLDLPDRVLSPNGRAHHMVKARAVKMYRLTAGAVALAAIGRNERPRWKQAIIQFAFYFPDARRRDLDNYEASMKSAVDGLRDAGVFEDDCWAKMTRLPSLVAVDAELPRVHVHVKPAEINP